MIKWFARRIAGAAILQAFVFQETVENANIAAICIGWSVNSHPIFPIFRNLKLKN